MKLRSHALDFRRMLALAPVICLGASIALAHPPERLVFEQFVEGFAEGFDQPGYVAEQNGVEFADGAIVIGAGGQFSLVDPQANGFAHERYSTIGFCDIEIAIHDDLESNGAWEVLFEGPLLNASVPSVTQLRLKAEGTTLTISYENDWVDRSVELERSSGWLVFRAGEWHSRPTIERDGSTVELSDWAYSEVDFRPQRVEVSGSHVRIDQVVITPWYFSVGTEERSWGGVKAGY